MAEFDPDAYLAQGEKPKTGGFDPDAYLGTKPLGVRQSESLARGATQGLTLGFGDELSGVVAAAFPALDPEAAGTGKTFGERYKAARDFYRTKNAAAQVENPKTYLTGQLAGGVAPAVAAPLGLAKAGGSLPMALAQGAVQGAGYSEHEGKRLLGDTALGAGLGAAGFGAGKALGYATGKLAGLASGKAGEAVGEAASKVNAAAQGELRSEVGSLGGKAQNLNRQIEWVIRLADEESSGMISPANKAALEAFRKTPGYGDVVNKAVERVLQQAPRSVADVAAQEAKVAALSSALPEKVASETAAAVSGKAAGAQLKARLLRYGLPAAGGAALGALGFGEDDRLKGALTGAGVGSLTGAGLRPMMHSLIRLKDNPAVRNQLYTAAERVLGGLKPALAPVAASGAAAMTAGLTRSDNHPAIADANRGDDR